MFEYYFEGRKPSEASVLKVLKDAIKQGYRKMEVSWGENMITVEFYNKQYIGHGWIKSISGQDIAKVLQSKIIY